MTIIAQGKDLFLRYEGEQDDALFDLLSIDSAERFLSEAIRFYASAVRSPAFEPELGYKNPKSYQASLQKASEEQLEREARHLDEELNLYLDDVASTLRGGIEKDKVFYWMEEGSLLPHIVLLHEYRKALQRERAKRERGYEIDVTAASRLFEEIYGFSCGEDFLMSFLDYLPVAISKDEYEALALRYGFCDGTWKTYPEVGATLGITRESVRQLLRSAKEKLSAQKYWLELTGKANAEAKALDEQTLLEAFPLDQGFFVQGRPGSGKTLFLRRYLRLIPGNSRILLFDSKGIDYRDFSADSRLIGNRIFTEREKEAFLGALRNVTEETYVFIDEAGDFSEEERVELREILEEIWTRCHVYATSQKELDFLRSLPLVFAKIEPLCIPNKKPFLVLGKPLTIVGVPS